MRDTDDAVLDENRAIQAGGGFGTILGRNSFERSKPDAVRLVNTIMDIYNTQPSQAQVPVLN